MAATNAPVAVRQLYRDLLRYAKSDTQQLDQLRRSFRSPLGESSIEARLRTGHDRLSFLKITNVKTKPNRQSGRWVYSNGKRLENVDGTLRDANGRVVSSYDGKNLDPEAVSRHQKGLQRAGFVNNAHAKGIF